MTPGSPLIIVLLRLALIPQLSVAGSPTIQPPPQMLKGGPPPGWGRPQRPIEVKLWEALPGIFAVCRFGGGERFVHDPPDGSRATPALGAAAETAINLARRPRRDLVVRQGRAYIVVGKAVAGTDNHCGPRQIGTK